MSRTFYLRKSTCCLRGGLTTESSFGLCGQSSKACRIVGGNVGKDLAVQAVARLLEAVDERRVAHTVQTRRCADTHNPQRAELALLLLAANVGKLQPALNCFLGGLVELGFGEEVTACALEDLFAAVIAFCTAFYTRHRVLLLRNSL